MNSIATNSKYEYKLSFSLEMPSYLNPLPAYNCFPTFTQSCKPNRGHLMWAQTKHQADFCHSGTYLLSCLSGVVLMESSELP